MDILGIGGWELVAIIIIMLVVAGPKRMIQWSYTAGKYVAIMRKMWAETAKQIQREFDDAGVDIQVPKDLPTRGAITKEVNRALSPVTKPIKDSLAATKSEIDGVKQAVDIRPSASSNAAKPKPEKPAAAVPEEKPVPTVQEPPVNATPEPSTPPAPSSNGSANGSGTSDFGTWSKKS